MNPWPDGSLRSPTSLARLRWDGCHALLGADGERWPVIDGIPFLRVGREALAHAALTALDSGRAADATVMLLGDRDDWASGPAADPDALRALVAERHEVSFREAMRRLAFGPVSDYFAHRWSDPTFLSGLALAEAYWRPGARVVELACGAGHFLRAFDGHAAAVTGIDVVFAKLWLVRHWIAPQARLVCCDAAHPWPLSAGEADLVFCHDALYFLPDKPAVVAQMQRVAGDGGSLLCGHAHNAQADNLSSGAPLSPQGYVELFGAATLYDDTELTAALLDCRAPRSAPSSVLSNAAAVAIAAGAAASATPQAVSGRFAAPRHGTPLRRNPLYSEQPDGSCVRRFPSERYAAEYGGLATYPERVAARPRIFAGADPEDDPLIRRRVWLDLPARW